MSGWKPWGIGAFLAIFLFAWMRYPLALANDYPPTPTNHFYGDADGDTEITVSDLNIVTNYLNAQPYTFGTLQPQNPDQDWNTCDVDSDQACTVSDKNILRNYINAQPVIIPDKPWHLINMNLPLSGNMPGMWIPFNANLFSTVSGMGESGRPGISVIAEIAPVGEGSTVSGQLAGRECDPVGGSRDQAALPGALCALSVTQTDWNAAPGEGKTEDGTYGFQIWACDAGTIQLNLRIEATAMDIPVVTTSVMVSFSINQPPLIRLDCPAHVDETQPTTCDLEATDPDSPPQTLTCALNEGTICNGATLNGCESVDIPARGEAYGPSYCFVVVDVMDDVDPYGTGYKQAYDLIAIDELNQNPAINVDCPVSALKNEIAYCQLTTSDADLPAQQLTCSVDAATTCTGVSLLGCNWVYIPAQGVAPLTCSVVVNVQDDFSPPGAGQGSDTINIMEGNTNPTVIVDCPTSVGELHGTSCALMAADSDLPPQALTSSLNASSTCAGAVVNGCTSVDVPAQGEAAEPRNCQVIVDVRDDFSPPGTGQGSDTMAILEENQNPVIAVNCPGSVSENQPTTCPITASDADLPAQTLICSLNAATTCTGVTLTDCTQANVPAQGGAPQTCSVVVNVQDDFNPPGTGQGSDTINIMAIPTVIVDCPASVGETQATSCALTASEAGLPPQALTCSINPSSSCAGAVVNGCTSVDLPAQGENQGPSVCQLIVDVRDDFSPPGTGQGNDTIAILEENQNPVIAVNCPASVNENQATTCPITATDADLPAQTLTCTLNAATTCTGVTLTGCTQANVLAQGEAAGPGLCSIVVDVLDNFAPPGTSQGSDSMTINEVNQIPVWNPMPSDIFITVSQTYNQNNGHATDADLPNTGSTDPGHLTCSNQSQTCSFPITVGGDGAGVVDCNINFTAGAISEVCYLTVRVDDGWTPSGSTTKTLKIAASGPGDVDWIGTSVTGALGGIRPVISRIRENYPADFGQITLNFFPNITSCSATVTCAAAGDVSVTGTVVGGGNCRLDAVSGYWPSNDTCTISDPVGSPACTGPNCFGSDVFKTSLRLSECAPRGGPCGGFIDDGSYGSGNSLEVDTVDFRSGTLLTGGGGNHVYVLVEHVIATPAVKIEAFDGDDNGIATISSADGLLSAEVKVTAAYKGNTTGMCDNSLAEYPKCYRFTTWDNLDSRKINLPMEQTTAADWQMPEAQIWGYTPIGYYSRMVGPRVLSDALPNPMRGGFALLGVLDQSMASINFAELLRTTGDLSTISLCFADLGSNIGGLSLPGNLVLPDVIRQTWNAACSGSIKMSPANTTFRIFTNRPNVQRKLIVLGASVNTTLFNLYKSLNIVEFPITMTALGTATLNVPAIATDINLGDSGGTWSPGTTVPRSVPFELDFRAPARGIGRFVNLNEFGFPPDQERVRMGIAANPDYGDPNRQRAASHVGQFYCLGEQTLTLGARAGSSGLIPFQLAAVPNIDDTQFTVFQRQNMHTKAFQDLRPFSSGGNTLTISATLRGLPSTAVDTGGDINWVSAEPGVVGILERGFIEPYFLTSGYMLATVPGGASNAQMQGPLEGINGTTIGAAVWLPLPEITDPTHNGYFVPPQAEAGRAWPINRNGQIMRGTARIASDFIHTAAGGARLFTLRNPQASTTPARYADMYILELVDTKHIANNYSDTPRGRPDNGLWKIYGAVSGQASLTVTLPYIMPRRATLGGVNGIVPDPWEAGNMTNQIMEWSLTENIIDTGARGINRAFDYQRLNIVWTFERSYLNSAEAHQFYWR